MGIRDEVSSLEVHVINLVSHTWRDGKTWVAPGWLVWSFTMNEACVQRYNRDAEVGRWQRI